MCRFLLIVVLGAYCSAEPCLSGQVSGSHKASQTPVGSIPLETLLRDSRRELFREQYDAALESLKSYLEKEKSLSAKPLLHFYVVDAIGQIYLRVKQDPDGALAFFLKAEKDPRLNAAQGDIIRGWIGAVREWKALGKMPKDVRGADGLYQIGKKYYESGLKRQKFEMDSAGSADFSIAATYFVPFTVHYDKDGRIAEVLFMMGDIRRRTWYDNEYWSQNYYLIEVIRRFPGTPIALKAYKALEDDVHFGYSGSSGDNTPKSWIELLKEFKALAGARKEPAIPLAPPILR